MRETHDGFSLLVLVAIAGLAGCLDTGGTLADDCTTDDDCADEYSCVKCSIQNTCYFDSQLQGDPDYEWACKTWGAGTPTDSRYGGGGGGGGGADCSKAWTCVYDGQASPLCQAACARSGSERTQTCDVLNSILEPGAGSCCPTCN